MFAAIAMTNGVLATAGGRTSLMASGSASRALDARLFSQQRGETNEPLSVKQRKGRS
jgi:hypothetical protein